MIEQVTFTGVDKFTDLTRCTQLSASYPIEWGVLISGASNKNRYPGIEFIAKFSNLPVKKAIHLCSVIAHDFQIDALDSQTMNLIKKFDRVQVNRRDKDYNYGKLLDMSERYDLNIIAQTRNEESLPVVAKGFKLQYLFDKSGGRGVFPDKIPQTTSQQFVGYAGGIRPHTLGKYMDMIESPRAWIDMETGVREEDKFSLRQCERVCRMLFGY